MLTLNELKHKLFFTQNIRRILESRKMIAAINSKKYSAQSQCANGLSHSVEIDHVLDILTPNALYNLNIIISAQSGLCGNFMIDLNKKIQEHMHDLSSDIEMHDIDTDDINDMVADTYDDIVDMYQEESIDECDANVVSEVDEALGHYWILIGNKKPDMLKNVKLYQHVQIEKDMLASLLTLTESIYQLNHKINKINIISWSNESTEPYVQVLNSRCYKYHDCTKSVLQNKDQYNDWYNMFMLQCYALLNAKLLTSLVREEKIRFLTMDQAINNADEMTQQLRNDVNQMRQSIITGELIEIITGAEFA